MIQYCITHMWLFHEMFQKENLKKNFNAWHEYSGNPLMDTKGHALKITYKEIKESYDKIADSREVRDGEINLKSPVIPDGTGMFEFKWRVFSDAEKKNHDGHPAIELHADKDSLVWLKKYLLAGTGIKNSEAYNLSHFKLRITDYQFLNVVTIFDAVDTEEFAELKRVRTQVVRNINPLVKALEINMHVLENEKYLIRTSDYFGLPDKLRDIIGLCYDDMYQYDEPAFLTGKHRNDIARIQEILDVPGEESHEIGNARIYSIEKEPPVFVFDQEEPLLPEVICEYIEPVNLLLAERAAKEDTVQIFYSIVDLAGEMNSINKLGKKKVTAVQRNRKNKFDQFEEEDLRAIILKLAFVLDKCIIRRSSLEDWQPEFFYEYQNKLDKETIASNMDMSERIKNYDRLLSVYLDEKGQQRESKHSKTQEAILGFFSFITFISFIVEIIDYLQKEKYDKWNLQLGSFELRLFLSLTLFIFVLGMYLFSGRRFLIRAKSE